MFGECHSESPRLPSVSILHSCDLVATGNLALTLSGASFPPPQKPWLSRSATTGSSPSPLTLPSPSSSSSSNPSTPTDVTATTRGIRARRRSSLEAQALELLEGLAEEFDAFALGQDKQSGGAFITPELEQVAVTEASAAGLQPEVDHQGNVSSNDSALHRTLASSKG